MGTELALDQEYALHHDTDDGWADTGLCKGMTEVFFGRPSERPERRRGREILAKSICGMCSVALACRRAGRLNHEHGIWGGENDEERGLAGHTPRSPSRRSVIAAQKQAGDSSAEPELEAALAS